MSHTSHTSPFPPTATNFPVTPLVHWWYISALFAMDRPQGDPGLNPRPRRVCPRYHFVIRLAVHPSPTRSGRIRTYTPGRIRPIPFSLTPPYPTLASSPRYTGGSSDLEESPTALASARRSARTAPSMGPTQGRKRLNHWSGVYLTVPELE